MCKLYRIGFQLPHQYQFCVYGIDKKKIYKRDYPWEVLFLGNISYSVGQSLSLFTNTC